MKTIISILTLSLVLCNLAMAQTTRPIENPHDLPIIPYATEVKPSHFAGIGTDTLTVVDTEGKHWVLLPRPHVGDASSAELSEERKEVLRHRHTLLSGANDFIRNEGLEAYLELLDDDPSVVSYTFLYADCLEIVFEDGEIYEKPIPTSDLGEVNTQPRLNPQEIWMNIIQCDLNEGRVPWFGTGHYTNREGTPEQLQLMREALVALKSGKTPTQEQLSSAPIRHEGVRTDALR
jgi:hypothetical protein